MEVKCPKCGATNEIDDGVFAFNEVVKINCKSCKVKIVVKRKVKKKSPPPVPSQDDELFKSEGFFVPDEEISDTHEEDMFRGEDLSTGDIDSAEGEDFFSAEDFSISDEKEKGTPEIAGEEDFLKTEDFGVEEGEGVEKAEESEEEAFYMPEEITPSDETYQLEDRGEGDELTRSLFEEEIPPPKPKLEPEPSTPVYTPPSQPPLRPSTSVKVVSTKPRTQKKGWFGMVFILFIIGGGVFGYWWKFWKSKNSGINPDFEIHIIETSSLVNRRGERIWYVKGVIAHTRGVLSRIKLKAILTDSNGFKITEKEIYAGNVISESNLRTLSPFEVESILQRETGESLSNVKVEPGKELPFMAVFYSPPRNAKLKIEVEDWQEEQ